MMKDEGAVAAPKRGGAQRAAQRRADRVRASVAAALRDFEFVGRPSVPVSLLSLSTHKGQPIAVIGAGKRVHHLPADRAPELMAQTVLLVQAFEEEQGKPWPAVPPFGVLRPSVRHGRAVWQTSGGDIFCDVGRLFDPDPM